MITERKHTRLIESFHKVRVLSLYICEPLEAEDYILQSTPDVSPPKWHLAHTTWFFETFLLSRFKNNFKPFDPQFHYLFNSYYKSLGPHLYRLNRGFLSRPGLSRVLKYRKAIDEQVINLLETCSVEQFAEIEAVVALGLNHEEQHQELLVTDIKQNLCTNPTHPVFFKSEVGHFPSRKIPPWRWVEFRGGIHSIGAKKQGFAFDNERPRHKTFLSDYQIASRVVNNGEFVEFIENGAYAKPDLWLSLGWDILMKENWEAPLYWEKQGGDWWAATLNGFERVNPSEPVCHISFFEADAFARWKSARLPTEAEWEVAAQTLSAAAIQNGNFLNSGALRPLPLRQINQEARLQQMFGDVWEWTGSAYLPYPGFKPLIGIEGEYNGKFMCNQMILRGGSCATPFGHVRTSYRNFFPPHSRWQFMGIRLARDCSSGS
ncbi:MAG: ergothioneine biosynthesis protein EgtB [Bdellovibrionia bacterium]